MASRKAIAYLATLTRVHTARELANFAAGSGIARRLPILPFHAIEMTERTGDSKRTIGHYATLADARNGIAEMDRNDRDTGAGGSDTLRRDATTRYIRDIRNGNIYRA